MSIIYDALKKSQHARAAKVQVSIARKPVNRRKQIIMISLIMTCLFVIVATLTMNGQPAIARFAKNDVIIKPTPAALAMASGPRLMLEGVFLSENERLAMINHRAYHEGDNINGMQVVTIAFDQVTLQNKSRSLVLRSALTQFD